MTEFVRVDEIVLGYTATGTGPGLLVPWCNHPWPDMPYFSALSEHFTVVLASPRGYQWSSRLTDDQPYDADMVVRDLLTVCDAVGLRRFSVLGYSLTAAMAAWLARSTLRVDAVVAGGFPLLGSYEAVRRGAERDAARLTAGDAQAASLLEQFDSRAVLSFYRALAELPDGALVDEVTCRMIVLWGTDDDVLGSFNITADYEQALNDRGVTTMTLQGLDHVGAILGLGDVLEDVSRWLLATPTT